MGKIINELDTARIDHYGVVSPLVYSVETLRRMMEMSDDLKQPVIVRVKEEYMNVEDVLYWVNEYAGNYPRARALVFVDDVKSYADALRVLKYDIDGIGYIGPKEDLAEIYHIAKVAKADVQVTMSLEEAKKLDAAADFDFVRLTDVKVDDQNVDEVIASLKDLKDFTHYALGDFEISRENCRKLVFTPAAKYDVFESLSDKCMDEIENICRNEKNHYTRFFMDKMVESAENLYCKGVEDRIFNLGDFIVR